MLRFTENASSFAIASEDKTGYWNIRAVVRRRSKHKIIWSGSSVWLECRPVTPEVAGSSPVQTAHIFQTPLLINVLARVFSLEVSNMVSDYYQLSSISLMFIASFRSPMKFREYSSICILISFQTLLFQFFVPPFIL